MPQHLESQQMLRHAYQNVFSTSQAQMVLQDLDKRAKLQRCCFRDGVNALGLAYWEGRRSIVLEIHHMLRQQEQEEIGA